MRKKNLLLKINSLTTGSVIVLILVGGIVRSLGAGMGCPDWPKCFGSYIPPTSEGELPENYLEVFRAERLSKNERLASTFEKLGYRALAHKITEDPAVLKEERFDVTKAWVEYLNRLLGVLIGLFVFANAALSVRFWKSDPKITMAGVSILVLTGFQGWVGSLVVSTNLLHGFITFHMLLALLILALLIWMNVRIRNAHRYTSRGLFLFTTVLLLLLIPQIILGTEVRGVVDQLISGGSARNTWTDQLTAGYFYVHRSYSWLLVIGAVVVFYTIRKRGYGGLHLPAIGLLVLVGSAMIAGVSLVKFNFPFWLQPLHLIIATGIFSLLFYLTLRIKFR